MKHFDLLIVGAGPAGSFAAELLAKGGARVAFFDGRPADEPKTCGGGVTPKGLKRWRTLRPRSYRKGPQSLASTARGCGPHYKRPRSLLTIRQEITPQTRGTIRHLFARSI